MCHVNNFKEFDKTIATYGYLRGTGEVLKKKVKNFFILIMVILNNLNENLSKTKFIKLIWMVILELFYNDY